MRSKIIVAIALLLIIVIMAFWFPRANASAAVHPGETSEVCYVTTEVLGATPVAVPCDGSGAWAWPEVVENAEAGEVPIVAPVEPVTLPNPPRARPCPWRRVGRKGHHRGYWRRVCKR